LAYLPQALPHSTQLNDFWLVVSNARIKKSPVRSKKQDLLYALSTEIRFGQSVVDSVAKAKARPILKLAINNALLERALTSVVQVL
jgi:hypothetical protein